MNSKVIVAIVTLTATLFLGCAFVGPAHATSAYGYGPESPEVNLYYFADETALYSAVKAGQIDLSLWEATAAQYRDAITDPNMVLCPVERLDMRAFSLNNNETIAALPGKRSATSDAEFRKSLWCMVDRAWYTEVICGGFATPLYVMISGPSRSWVNKTVEDWVKVNYAYNILTAGSHLDAGGFIQRDGLEGRPGPDPNPYYDPNVPGSARYWRGYPAGWPHAGERVDPVVFSARVDDGLRFAASVHMRDRMLLSGIQVNFIPEPSSSAFLRVMTARNYQIYSAGWTTGRFATYSWSWYHTSRWVPGGSNYHVSTTSPGYDLCTKPDKRADDLYDLDYWASKVWYPPNLGEAVKAAQNVQELSTLKYATFIPLWGGKAFFYYRNLYGVTNMDGVGPENTYTYQALRRADGGTPIRVGHKSPPTQVNQIYSSWVWDVTTMGQTQDGFYNLEPFNLLNEQPGLAQDWTNAPGAPATAPGEWVDPDDKKTKSMMRYWFIEDPTDGSFATDSPTTHNGDADAEWIRQGTPAQGGGTILADFAEQWLGGGYEFNSWYYDTEAAGWIYSGYRDIKHIECHTGGVGQNYADVYFDVASYWTFTWPWGRHIYAVEPASYDQTLLGWKTSPLSQQETRSFGPLPKGAYLNDYTPTGGGLPIPTRARGTPVEVISVTFNGSIPGTKALTPHLYDPTIPNSAGGDYSIVGSSGKGPRIRIFSPASSLTVTYWARGDPAGYWPGNTNFQTTLIGTGQYYMTDFRAGAGGYATYKANAHNYMATPPDGEIDWYWYWINPNAPDPRTQPGDGYYKTDIYDAAYASSAMGGTGSGLPPPTGPRPPTKNWVPAADLTAPLGEIDINDIAILAANFDTEFSSPYPNPPSTGPGPH